MNRQIMYLQINYPQKHYECKNTNKQKFFCFIPNCCIALKKKQKTKSEWNHFIHLIDQLYSFSRINVALIMLTVQVVSFLNRFDCKTVIHCCSAIPM